MMMWETGMNQDWKTWEHQFGSNFGARELLRFLGVFAVWLFLGWLISLMKGDYVLFYPFLITAFAFPLACSRWKPAYALLRVILGNPNLPSKPRPSKSLGQYGRRAWWSVGSGVSLWLLVFLLAYVIIRDFVR
jgi:hypothetical protein